jgi:glycosyltransferase involved in cell wall biosynthesis
MRILILHNRYREPGGEDRVVQEEALLLRKSGEEVEVVEFDNEGSSLGLAMGAAWSRPAHAAVLRACRGFRPDVAHVHNFWMRLSPSAHSACAQAGVPTVQTLHNYRLLCVNALLMRDGKPCEDCVGKSPWRGVTRRCYRNSFVPSAAVAAMIAVNRARKTWRDDVRVFVAPSRFCASRLVRGGIDERRLVVKQHFTADPGDHFPPPSQSADVVFVGRLSEEKGASVLLRAWREAGLAALGTLWIVGDGPERRALEQECGPGVRFTGARPFEDVLDLVGHARTLVVPSVCYETFGRAVIEGFACGRSVVASAIGAIGEAVENERTGFTFPAGDASALGAALRRLLSNPALADTCGANARREYLARYTPAVNYQLLRAVYERAMGTAAANRGGSRGAGVVLAKSEIAR